MQHRTGNLAPGWLRDEMNSALLEVRSKAYISEQWKKSYESASDRLSHSEMIERSVPERPE
jgi:hypothetical protein